MLYNENKYSVEHTEQKISNRFAKMDRHLACEWLIYGPKHHKDNQSQSLKHPVLNDLVGKVDTEQRGAKYHVKSRIIKKGAMERSILWMRIITDTLFHMLIVFKLTYRCVLNL